MHAARGPEPMHHLHKKKRGFTAIEALVAAAILAIVTAAVSGALMAGRAQTRLARDTLSASFLGQSLMDEIMRLPYNDPSPGQTMTTRSTFDHISDFGGYSDGPGGLTDQLGNAYTDANGNDNFPGFSRAVTMTQVSNAPTGWGRTLNGLLVTVTVTKDSVELVRVQRIAWQ